MTENLLQSLQQLVQDVIAPDVCELKVRLASLEKQIEIRFAALDDKFAALDDKFATRDEKNDAQFKALMAAIAESKAQTELTNVRMIAALSERVAVLESQRH